MLHAAALARTSARRLSSSRPTSSTSDTSISVYTSMNSTVLRESIHPASPCSSRCCGRRPRFLPSHRRFHPTCPPEMASAFTSSRLCHSLCHHRRMCYRYLLHNCSHNSIRALGAPPTPYRPSDAGPRSTDLVRVPAISRRATGFRTIVISGSSTTTWWTPDEKRRGIVLDRASES